MCGADFGVPLRVGFGILPGAEVRAKSLIDAHIDGRVLFGLEWRSHPRIDPPLDGASAGLGLGPQAAEHVAASARVGVLALSSSLLTFDLRVRLAT